MKDYYLLLGVNKEADRNEIKKAYRDSAKKYHPDGGDTSKDSKRFREITEAYETLSDNNRRKKYDENLGDGIPVNSLNNAEPLKQGFSQYQRGYDPNPYIRDHTDDTPSQFFNRSNAPQNTLNCAIHLSHEDVQHDIQYPYTVNIVKPCPHCNSFFSEFMFFCPYCNGSQYLNSKKELIINIPKGINSGTCVRLDLDQVGLSDVKLIVKVIVSSNLEEL